jgi:hypothetical protein
MDKLRFSYFQLTFGQKEAYLHPELTYARLKKYGYSAIEITPPKGRYGLGVSMEKYLERHKQLKAVLRAIKKIGYTDTARSRVHRWYRIPTPPAGTASSI